MASKVFVQFIDSHPARGSKRDQELTRAEARSHAAKIAYARKGIYVDQNDVVASAVADLPHASISPSLNSHRLTAQTSPTSKALLQRTVRPWQKFNQKDVPFNRFRVGAYKPTRPVAKAVEDTPEGDDGQRKVEATAYELVVRSFVPALRGNSDPFNATVVRLSPVEHVLLQQSRDQLIWSVWPSEIAIRHNKDAIAHSSWKIVPPTLHDESANYALIAQSYYSHATRQRAAGLPPDKGLIQAEKYKFQALRGLQELLELNRQSPGDRTRLRGMFLACCWLAGSELLCHNWDAAEMHYIAMRKIVELSGGWGAFSRMEREILHTAACFLASGKRSRPVIELDDPGHWHTFKTSKHLPPDGPNLIIPATAATTSIPPATAKSARLWKFFDDFRELLAVEEIKLLHRSSKNPSAVQMFRWSHARRIAVRGRSLHYWCDLLDEARANGATIITPIGTPLAVTLDFALCVATRCFDRCIFDDHYLPGGVYAESKRYHMELLSVMQPLRPVADDFSPIPDEHTFDVLWIYSIGAYVEDVFMRPELEKKGLIAGPPLPEFAKRFFSTRFSYLAAANLQFTKFEDISRFLSENYLYCPRLQDQSLRKLVSFGTEEQLTMEEVLGGP
ncbi:hypothetical protein H2200_011633 [Cladophialophora chaetospira]|uniref:Uncharacterized protein n=1 Tax=Cladophialophora chaetospira TaxID=386627 RepID=A0AA38WZQ3_9EURO|nr:hypothetical protein H2200_011633 [Cladophialophora chaetospira]